MAKFIFPSQNNIAGGRFGTEALIAQTLARYRPQNNGIGMWITGFSASYAAPTITVTSGDLIFDGYLLRETASTAINAPSGDYIVFMSVEKDSRGNIKDFTLGAQLVVSGAFETAILPANSIRLWEIGTTAVTRDYRPVAGPNRAQNVVAGGGASAPANGHAPVLAMTDGLFSAVPRVVISPLKVGTTSNQVSIINGANIAINTPAGAGLLYLMAHRAEFGPNLNYSGSVGLTTFHK